MQTVKSRISVNVDKTEPVFFSDSCFQWMFLFFFFCPDDHRGSDSLIPNMPDVAMYSGK